MSTQQRSVTPLQSVVAGTVAGGLESLITVRVGLNMDIGVISHILCD